MSTPADSPPPPRPRKSDLDRVFGDVLPDTTTDERDPEPADRDQDDWYRSNRPPHHGG